MSGARIELAIFGLPSLGEGHTKYETDALPTEPTRRLNWEQWPGTTLEITPFCESTYTLEVRRLELTHCFVIFPEVPISPHIDPYIITARTRLLATPSERPFSPQIF